MSALILGFVLVYLWPTGSFLVNSPRFIDDAGYGIVNFAYLYILGRYIRLHYAGRHSARYYGMGYAATCLALFATQALVSLVLGFDFSALYCYNTVFILLSSVFLFLCFRELKFRSKTVNRLAAYCLAVYLIHEAPPNIWGLFCSAIRIDQFQGAAYIAVLILLPVAIYLCCALVERLRLLVFQRAENKLIQKLLGCKKIANLAGGIEELGGSCRIK